MQAKISVLIPMFNAEGLIAQCLKPLQEMRRRGEIADILVVDDCSTDSSAEVVKSLNVRMIRTPVQAGPGAARNLGVSELSSEIVWFVDSDVIVQDHAAVEVAAGFDSEDVAAVFGSYDDNPAARNFLSQYKNLVHRYYHQSGQEDASTFWAGCGAVRRDVFNQVNGFDQNQYPFPSIEDIELGYRIRQAGYRIRLITSLQGKHLKDWRLKNLLHTEIFRRAIPWSRLMLRSNELVNDLNVGVGERIRAIIAGAVVLAIFVWALGYVSWIWPSLAFLLVIVMNARFLKFFISHRGPLFAIRALLFHQLYYLYSSMAFAFVLIQERLFRRA